MLTAGGKVQPRQQDVIWSCHVKMSFGHVMSRCYLGRHPAMYLQCWTAEVTQDVGVVPRRRRATTGTNHTRTLLIREILIWALSQLMLCRPPLPASKVAILT